MGEPGIFLGGSGSLWGWAVEEGAPQASLQPHWTVFCRGAPRPPPPHTHHVKEIQSRALSHEAQPSTKAKSQADQGGSSRAGGAEWGQNHPPRTAVK